MACYYSKWSKGIENKIAIGFPTNANKILEGVKCPTRIQHLTLFNSLIPSVKSFSFRFYCLRKLVIICPAILPKDEEYIKLTTFLRDCHQLEEFWFWVENLKTFEGSSENYRLEGKDPKIYFEIDFAKLNLFKTLKCLCLKNVAITPAFVHGRCIAESQERYRYGPVRKRNECELEPFSQLEEMYLDSVYLNLNDSTNSEDHKIFHQKFPVLKKLVMANVKTFHGQEEFRARGAGSSQNRPRNIINATKEGPSYQLLSKILQIKIIQNIYIFGFDSCQPFVYKIDKEVLAVLKKCGVNAKKENNFSLERISEPGTTKIYEEYEMHADWIGTPLKENIDEIKLDLEFEFMKRANVFKDKNTFQKFRQENII